MPVVTVTAVVPVVVVGHVHFPRLERLSEDPDLSTDNEAMPDQWESTR